jgi:tetratricopeptide (TPR) repeat protein
MDDVAAFCPDDRIQAAVAITHQSDDAGLVEIDRLLGIYSRDPRLHFLKGSILAGVQRYEEGRAAMRQAIDIAPDYHLARFQLGFLEFTSGMPQAAVETWTPFIELDEGAAFRLLSEGLNKLAYDEFAEADSLLRRGVAANFEHPLINADMQLLLDDIADKLTKTATHDEQPSAVGSAAHQMLQQFELRGTMNKTRH